jgi:hypothetical protein
MKVVMQIDVQTKRCEDTVSTSGEPHGPTRAPTPGADLSWSRPTLDATAGEETPRKAGV